MGPKYIDIEISKSAATIGCAQGCFFSAQIALFGFSKSAATTGRAQGCFFSAEIALLGFSKPGGPYLGPYGPYSLLPRWGPGALLGPLFACFFNA